MDTSTSSSSSLKRWKYDVYLSFRGEDTRKNFTAHLYSALKDAEVNIFRDVDELRRGESPGDDLIQVIEGSKVAVIVFSRRYAESSWCLDELVKIMECRRTLDQIVFPIFYDVDPSDVRAQTGTFATAFLNHEWRLYEVKEKLQLWRDALTEAANLSGFDVRNTDGDEAKSIMEIVAHINKVLLLSTAVGIDSRVKEISNYLDVGGSDDVRIIGIWGMGGLGKTTVAKAIFDKYYARFQGKSFLANVREKKLVDLQNTLLYDVLRSGNIKVRRVDEGTEDIKRRLSNLRVLVIVDGVDSVKQLESLAIKFNSFGPGSRIIITTRDQHLLKILKANWIYHLPAMNKEEALELLRRRAKNDYSSKEFLQVSREVVDYCGGLPLALEVFGSYLSRTSMSEWKSKLEKFKSHHSMEILNRLKISFDELADDDLKAIFLDISCFFAGMNKDYVMKILDGCDLYPEIGISVLQERCLVTTKDDFTLGMHDLLLDMGRYIVHAESPDDPGKRSRLWQHDDVIDVLKNESGTEAIQGLTLDLEESDETSFSTEAFRNMHSLRLLKLNYVKLTGSYNNLPNELRWLCWHGFPREAIPKDFDHPNIVVIDFSYSKLTRVWEDSNLLLEKLKFLNLSHSHNLTQSLDFSKTPNLERLILKDCKNLQEILALPTNLEILDADECIALEKMPNFSEMSRMRELHLNHSPKLSEILGLDEALNCMTSIHMEGCTNLSVSFKEAILQEWSARGNGGLFLPGNEISSWFTPVDPEGEIVGVPYSSDDLSHENQSCKRLSSDPSVERNAEEETDEIMKKKNQGMSEVGDLFRGAGLGLAFNMLYGVLKELIIKNVKFKPLKRIKSRLDHLAPLLKDIQESNKKWDLPVNELEKLKENLEEGIKLLSKCPTIRWWNIYNRKKYSKKLSEWDESLQQHLEILNVQGIRDVKDIAVTVKIKEEAVRRIELKQVILEQLDSEAFWKVPELPPLVVGLDFPLEELKRMLLKDENVSMVVLTAPGGCGKTTLAMKFCQDEEVKDKFNENIFFVTVSKHPNSDVEKLYQRMKSQEAGQNPLLLVLDDVWSNTVLQKLVELKLRNYKILVTSRSEFPGFGTPYQLQPLNDKDSMTLLRHSAALGDSLSVPEDLLREMLKHCKGVPLAITVTGNSLRGQAVESWFSRLEDWRRGSILDYETELHPCLRSSIDALEPIIRECFMDLVSFPEDQRISAAAFIDMWAELYMLDGDFQSIKNLHKLARKGLANLVITRKENMAILDNYYSEHFVRQHDMLRELGIYIAKLDPIEDRKRLIVVSGRNQPTWLREQKSQPINARLLSISSDGTYPTQWQSVHLPQVEVLVLNFKTEKNALPEFVQKIDKLKVLIVTNYGLSPTELSNFDLLESLLNLKRIRLESISIRSVTRDWVPLHSLKKISLFMCDMGQAFHNCSIKISDAWPGLEEMNIDYCHDLVELPAELCDLVHMKVLSITNCQKLSSLPEEIGKLKNLDVLRLRSCTELVRLPVSIENLTKLRCLDMYNCFGIRKLPEGMGKMRGLRKINMGQCSRLDELPLSVWDLDEQLEEVICDEEMKPFWDSFLARDKIKVAKEKSNLNWPKKLQL